MKIKNLLKQSGFYLSIGMCLSFSSCDNGDGDGKKSDIDKFIPGFNPETIQVDSQVWLINNTDSSNIVASVISESTIDYDYTYFGVTISSNARQFTFNSLGTSAVLRSDFNFTGNANFYSILTDELSDGHSNLSLALTAFVASDKATAADVIKAANEALPDLIIFFEDGKFYTLDTLELITNDNNQGTQILTGGEILFSDGEAREGSAGTTTQTNTVEVSYRRTVGQL